MNPKLVYLIDNENSGHHKVYVEALLQLSDVENFSFSQKFENNKKNFLKYLRSRTSYLDACVQVKGINHLLYLDNLYISFWKNRKRVKVIATLHHLPNSNLKWFFLKRFAKRINKIVVHSAFLEEEMKKHKIMNVMTINYPSFFDYSSIYPKEILRKEKNIDRDKLVMSFLGGTRRDKGLDIFLESVHFLSDKAKEILFINIVGKEEDVKLREIQGVLERSKMNYCLNLQSVTDKEFMENIVVSDVICLPYRKIFTGNSGPMTEAIINRIPIIAPDSLNIGKLVEKYHLGVTFMTEDAQDLARCINNYVQNQVPGIESSYYELLNQTVFMSHYKELYYEVKNQ